MRQATMQKPARPGKRKRRRGGPAARQRRIADHEIGALVVDAVARGDERILPLVEAEIAAAEQDEGEQVALLLGIEGADIGDHLPAPRVLALFRLEQRLERAVVAAGRPSAGGRELEPGHSRPISMMAQTFSGLIPSSGMTHPFAPDAARSANGWRPPSIPAVRPRQGQPASGSTAAFVPLSHRREAHKNRRPVVNDIVNSFLLIYAGLFPIVNPIGGAPIFLGLTRHRTD